MMFVVIFYYSLYLFYIPLGAHALFICRINVWK